MVRARKPDRRVERTRQHLLDAFRDLVLTRGYDAVTVRDVVEAANVGRSTFYEHFEHKDALLEASLQPLLTMMADAVRTDDVAPGLSMVISHFGDNRRLARIMMAGSARRLMTRFLSNLIETRLPTVAREMRATRPLLPLRLIAAHLADGQLGLIEAWLSGKTGPTPEAVARALHISTRASAVGLLAPRTSS